MVSKTGREVTVLLKSTTAEPGPDGQPEILCLGCRGPLDIHQPDAELPDLMLATCPACKAWHLVDFQGDDDIATLIKFPDLAQLRKVLRA